MAPIRCCRGLFLPSDSAVLWNCRAMSLAVFMLGGENTTGSSVIEMKKKKKK